MKLMSTYSIILLSLSLYGFLLIGCGAAGPEFSGQAVNTPDYYSENKVLFVEDTVFLKNRFRTLMHSYEIPYDSTRDVRKLAPLGVIIREVRLPADLKGTRDIAVILDVVTAGEESVTSLVAFYQRDVPGGQMLNFQDLLVYYDPEWDGVTPPWFRVRILEVNAERNTRISNFLNETNKLTGALAGMVPHPVLPSVRTAIEAAKLVLGNRKNKVILDYQVQFYSRAQVVGSASDLMPLRIGEWIVIGRARGENSSFWNKSFEMNVRTGRIHVTHNNSILLDDDLNYAEVPYVSLTLMSADAAIPKHILDRSQALLQLLDSPTERVNFDAMSESVSSLNSAVQGYNLERRVKKYTTKQDFIDLINLIKEYNGDKGEVKSGDLKITQIRSLIRLFNELTDNNFGTPQEVIEWWGKNAEGTFGKDTTAKWGVIWTMNNK